MSMNSCRVLPSTNLAALLLLLFVVEKGVVNAWEFSGESQFNPPRSYPPLLWSHQLRRVPTWKNDMYVDRYGTPLLIVGGQNTTGAATTSSSTKRSNDDAAVASSSSGGERLQGGSDDVSLILLFNSFTPMIDRTHSNQEQGDVHGANITLVPATTAEESQIGGYLPDTSTIFGKTSALSSHSTGHILIPSMCSWARGGRSRFNVQRDEIWSVDPTTGVSKLVFRDASTITINATCVTMFMRFRECNFSSDSEEGAQLREVLVVVGGYRLGVVSSEASPTQRQQQQQRQDQRDAALDETLLVEAKLNVDVYDLESATMYRNVTQINLHAEVSHKSSNSNNGDEPDIDNGNGPVFLDIIEVTLPSVAVSSTGVLVIAAGRFSHLSFSKDTMELQHLTSPSRAVIAVSLSALAKWDPQQRVLEFEMFAKQGRLTDLPSSIANNDVVADIFIFGATLVYVNTQPTQLASHNHNQHGSAHYEPLIYPGFVATLSLTSVGLQTAVRPSRRGTAVAPPSLLRFSQRMGNVISEWEIAQLRSVPPSSSTTTTTTDLPNTATSNWIANMLLDGATIKIMPRVTVSLGLAVFAIGTSQQGILRQPFDISLTNIEIHTPLPTIVLFPYPSERYIPWHLYRSSSSSSSSKNGAAPIDIFKASLVVQVIAGRAPFGFVHLALDPQCTQRVGSPRYYHGDSTIELVLFLFRRHAAINNNNNEGRQDDGPLFLVGGDGSSDDELMISLGDVEWKPLFLCFSDNKSVHWPLADMPRSSSANNANNDSMPFYNDPDGPLYDLINPSQPFYLSPTPVERRPRKSFWRQHERDLLIGGIGLAILVTAVVSGCAVLSYRRSSSKEEREGDDSPNDSYVQVEEEQEEEEEEEEDIKTRNSDTIGATTRTQTGSDKKGKRGATSKEDHQTLCNETAPLLDPKTRAGWLSPEAQRKLSKILSASSHQNRYQMISPMQCGVYKQQQQQQSHSFFSFGSPTNSNANNMANERMSENTFLVRRKADRTSLVMKYVDCEEDLDRLRCFREFESMQTYQGHPHVIGLVDMFMSYSFGATGGFGGGDKDSGGVVAASKDTFWPDTSTGNSLIIDHQDDANEQQQQKQKHVTPAASTLRSTERSSTLLAYGATSHHNHDSDGAPEGSINNNNTRNRRGSSVRPSGNDDRYLCLVMEYHPLGNIGTYLLSSNNGMPATTSTNNSFGGGGSGNINISSSTVLSSGALNAKAAVAMNPPNESLLLSVAQQVLSALRTMHTSSPATPHRSVKPESVMVRGSASEAREGNGTARCTYVPVCVSDFGFASLRNYTPPELLHNGRCQHCAAQQFSSAATVPSSTSHTLPRFFGEQQQQLPQISAEDALPENYTCASDIWCLGATVYSLATSCYEAEMPHLACNETRDLLVAFTSHSSGGGGGGGTDSPCSMSEGNSPRTEAAAPADSRFIMDSVQSLSNLQLPPSTLQPPQQYLSGRSLVEGGGSSAGTPVPSFPRSPSSPTSPTIDSQQQQLQLPLWQRSIARELRRRHYSRDFCRYVLAMLRPDPQERPSAGKLLRQLKMTDSAVYIIPREHHQKT